MSIESHADEWAAVSPDTPRVNQCIGDMMKRFPGVSAHAHARYYEEVHQELAPLARQLERELAEAKRQMAAMWDQFKGAHSAEGGSGD